MFSSRQGFYIESGLGTFSPLTIVANVSRTDSGPANTFQIQFQAPMTSANIDWGDGNTQTVTTTGPVTKTYSTGGNKTIAIDGIFGAAFGNGTANKVVDVTSWGNSKITNAYNMMNSCQLTTFTASDSPVFEQGANLSRMFLFTTNFVGNISNWNTSNVTNMAQMFHTASAFNGNISTWNVNNVTTMSAMFINASSFNQDLSGWNTSNVANMNQMFYNANAFNGNISTWNTSNVTIMTNMFGLAGSFNRNISTWNVSKVTDMNGMFFEARNFNNGSTAGVRNTGLNRTSTTGWRVGNVTGSGMVNMFANCVSANLDVSNWCTTSITTKPAGFDTGAGNIVDPTWGTCPIPN